MAGLKTLVKYKPMSFQKVIILNFPKIALESPPLAPAILSSICDSLSIEHDFIDCNLELHEQLQGGIKEEILARYAERFVDHISEEARYHLYKYFDQLANRCCHYDLIAISVFSVHSVVLTHDFLSRYRHDLDAKVVIGGAGIRSNGIGDATRSCHEPFYKTLHEQNLIDYWVLGEGEEAFRKILMKDTDCDIINNNQFNSLEDFNLVPIPNFDKYCLEKYMVSGKKIAPIEGSRGCVKKCTFCDINQTWGKFKYKDGEKLAKEIVFLQNKYDIDHFWFNDSLINGSMKSFREFTDCLANTRPDNLTWSSQAIVRPKSAQDRKDFDLMKRSGCNALAVGLESFSERARFHMGKKFTDEDLASFMTLAQEFSISVILLLIVGYPIETQEDIDQAFVQLEKYSYLADDGTISFLRIGNTMSIIPDTPIWHQLDKLGIELDSSQASNIFWKKGYENTLEKRIQWRMDLEDYARSLGYNCLDKEMHAEQTLMQLIKNLNEKSATA